MSAPSNTSLKALKTAHVVSPTAPVQRLLAGAHLGSHAERLALARHLSLSQATLSVLPQGRLALQEALMTLETQQLNERYERRLVMSELLKEARATHEGQRPWRERIRLTTMTPEPLLVGPFKLCFDDSLLGDPWALLLHQGSSPGFRATPPALTLPTEGPLRVAELSALERDGARLSVRLLRLGEDAQGEPTLVEAEGPWWLTPHSAHSSS